MAIKKGRCGERNSNEDLVLMYIILLIISGNESRGGVEFLPQKNETQHTWLRRGRWGARQKKIYYVSLSSERVRE